MLRLGHGNTKDFDRIAKILALADFDILSAQEIMTKEGAYDVLDSLNSQGNENWEILLSDRATGETSYKEFFAYYYKSDKVLPKTRGNLFCTGGKAYAYEEGGCFAKDFRREEGIPDFSRDPYVSQFLVNNSEIAIVSNHMHYGSSSSMDIAIRQKEMVNLKKVMNSIKEASPTATVTALGDFNLKLPVQPGTTGPEEVPAEFFEENGRVTGLIDSATTLGNSSYDHFFFYEDANCIPEIHSAKVYETESVSTENLKTAFKKEVSDHLPIGVTIKC